MPNQNPTWAKITQFLSKFGLTLGEDAIDVLWYVAGMFIIMLPATLLAVIPNPSFEMGTIIPHFSFGWFLYFLVVIGAIAFLLYESLHLWRANEIPRYWIGLMSGGATLILLLGLFGCKVEAGLIGLILTTIPLIVIGFAIAFGVWVVEGTISVGQGLTFKEAQDASRAALKGVFSIGAWLWLGGLVITLFGPYMSGQLEAYLLFSAIFLFFAATGWFTGMAIARSASYWLVGIGLSATIVYLLTVLLDAFGLWYGIVEPFFIAAIPLSLWFALQWLRRAAITRTILFTFGLLLFLRGMLIHVSPVTWERLPFDARPVLVVPTPLTQLKVAIKEQEKAALEAELQSLKQEVMTKKHPTRQEVQAWEDRLNEIAVKYPEFTKDSEWKEVKEIFNRISAKLKNIL